MLSLLSRTFCCKDRPRLYLPVNWKWVLALLADGPWPPIWLYCWNKQFLDTSGLHQPPLHWKNPGHASEGRKAQELTGTLHCKSVQCFLQASVSGPTEVDRTELVAYGEHVRCTWSYCMENTYTWGLLCCLLVTFKLPNNFWGKTSGFRGWSSKWYLHICYI